MVQSCPRCSVATSEHVWLLTEKVIGRACISAMPATGSFTVKMGTVIEFSHLSYGKWALAFHLLATSKKRCVGPPAAPHAWHYCGAANRVRGGRQSG